VYQHLLPTILAELPLVDEGKLKAYAAGVAVILVCVAGIGMIAAHKKAETDELLRRVLHVCMGALVFSLAAGFVAFGDRIREALGL
jgi:hypothetical protein